MPTKGLYGTKLWRVLSLDMKLDLVNDLSDEGLSANEVAKLVGLSKKRICILRGMYRKRCENGGD